MTKTNSNPKGSREQLARASSKERKSSLSDCSTSSVPSRKNSETNSSVHDEKPDTKNGLKEPNTPPKRNKRKQESHRPNGRYTMYQEPTEPKIVTEEISDPWEKRKLKELEDEKKNRKKSKPTKKEATAHHAALHKENSNGSSVEDDHQDEKPHGFTTVEKVKNRKRMEYSGHGTMDKLDEISLSGPRPDGRETYPRKTTARQEVLKNNKMNRAKKTAYHHEKERLMTSSDTPTSPHAIAAAIVDLWFHMLKIIWFF